MRTEDEARSEHAPRPVPMSGMPALDRTFEAIALDWDGTAVPDRLADASRIRERIEALCAAGVDVAIVTGTHIGNIDRQLHARPSGPGRLFLCINRGSEVFAVGQDGPVLLFRRTATREEDSALDHAATFTIAALARRGLHAEVVSQRLNRRKIDLIPVPEWNDPRKAELDRLLAAVTDRLRTAGIDGLQEVVGLAMEAAARAGLSDPRVTSDVKHVEIGLTDKSHSIRWFVDDLATRGIGPGLLLIVGDEFGRVGGVPGSDSLMLLPRARAVSVGIEPEGLPPGVTGLGGGPETCIALLEDQLRRRGQARAPSVDEDPAWTIVLRFDATLRRVQESLLTLADGRFGTRGATEDARGGAEPMLLASGVYTRDGRRVDLLSGPVWTEMEIPPLSQIGDRRVLDLRTGVLMREHPVVPLRSTRFVSITRRGIAAFRAEGRADHLAPGPVFRGDGSDTVVRSPLGGGIAAAGCQHEREADGLRLVERIAAFVASPNDEPPLQAARDALAEATRDGYDRLLAEQRAAWADRWDDALVEIGGDPDAELAVRFAVFHLLSSAPDDGEAAVGARGLSGGAYSGHVFWDGDVFVLPALAAIRPNAARAMLQYRINRLDAARQIAAQRQLRGARFPWESADDGHDVTPAFVKDANGATIPIRTGEREEHIVADVAWAAVQYVRWTGDDTFLATDGAPLVIETARYWASRIRFDQTGAAHLFGVIGPDEYHAPVDDSAFTNVMARWNLRAAASLVRREGLEVTPEEVEGWVRAADALVDGYDPQTGVYEQFAGFHRLEPIIIAELAEPLIPADLILGAKRVQGAQVIKQPDVCLLHHLVPEETVADSLRPNLEYYGPRTAHGSSLSPAMHALLLARDGRPDEALPYFRIAARLDLDDLTGSTAGGLHLATMGGVWQALAFGFGGLREHNGVLHADPHLPPTWTQLRMRFRFRGARMELRADHQHSLIQEVP